VEGDPRSQSLSRACEFVKELCKHSGERVAENKSSNKSNAIKIKALRAVTTAGQTIAEPKEAGQSFRDFAQSSIPGMSCRQFKRIKTEFVLI